MVFRLELHSIKPSPVRFTSLEMWKLILAYTHTCSKIPKENSKAPLFNSTKAYIILDYPMKQHITKDFLVENNLWAGIPKGFLKLNLALLKLE